MTSLLTRLARDESANDIIEYALLAMFIGVIGAAVWTSIQANIATAYRSYDTGVQAIWETPDPAGGGL